MKDRWEKVRKKGGKSKGEQQREGIYVMLMANIEKKKIGWKNKMNWFKIYMLCEASMHHDWFWWHVWDTLCLLLNMPKTDIRLSKNRHKPSCIIHIIHMAGQRSSTLLLCELQAPQACKKCR